VGCSLKPALQSTEFELYFYGTQHVVQTKIAQDIHLLGQSL
jgi:hypothetical protein